MAGKLALVFILMHLIHALTLPTPYENTIASNSLASANTLNKRYYFPETLPDQDELEAMLKETAMREAGFVPSSNPPSKLQPESKHKIMETETETELQLSLPNPDPAIGTDAAVKQDRYAHQNTKPKKSKSKSHSHSHLKDSIVDAFESDDYPIYWPPFGFFVISAAIVCFFTILRGIRAKK
ncbi:uncharacterized protein N7479_005403 [Penicillium vulpinum]|uniref:Protein BIG1 n=1 Tax=Penicillium vulpinum TaxID=29845 RepID=A0A1V6RK56_9EURO|nr:uncharacterized protein N7479_005403 [Penicillium vulpinum]KAJ5958253.1 hypothetical protein N7479_005403 [Penicillium vulpinum]OQE02175.1 hypothetical protein PENVUL_c040G04519 [Penicillium vulpinum]